MTKTITKTNIKEGIEALREIQEIVENKLEPNGIITMTGFRAAKLQLQIHTLVSLFKNLEHRSRDSDSYPHEFYANIDGVEAFALASDKDIQTYFLSKLVEPLDIHGGND